MKDRFSAIATTYAAFRPTYPAALYEFIFRQLGAFETAWDAGTGNGQVAVDLSQRFKQVIATDISAQQLANAPVRPNISYRVAGELTDFADHTIDLVTVAQAIHWFDRVKFYREVIRVACPDAVVAVWGYGLVKVTPAVDELVTAFYTGVVGPYWDPERKLIDQRYETIDFPFQEITSPSFEIKVTWQRSDFLGYLNTWSALRNYSAEKGTNPLEEFYGELTSVWKDDPVEVRFPLFLRIGKV